MTLMYRHSKPSYRDLRSTPLRSPRIQAKMPEDVETGLLLFECPLCRLELY